MSILHLVRTSAYQHDDLAQCLQVFGVEDTIILMDDGCYNLTHSLLTELTHKNVYAIKEHCQARAVKSPSQQLNLSELTPLFLTHNSVITWQ